MRLLDLFCGAGGASMGYHRAGFEVVGVDCEPQPHYPFEFVRFDAIEYLREHWHQFDAIHASPPCQHATRLRHLHKHRSYPALIDPIRAALDSVVCRPWVIENVPGSELYRPIVLCGSMFGLGAVCADGKWHQLRRHRLFESNVDLFALQCRHHGRPICVCGNGGGGGVLGGYVGVQADRREAMTIDWMNSRELSQAIPPAYTHFIGGQLMRAGRILARLQRGYAEGARSGRVVESADLWPADAGPAVDGAGDGGPATEPVGEMPGRPDERTVGPGPAGGVAGGGLPV